MKTRLMDCAAFRLSTNAAKSLCARLSRAMTYVTIISLFTIGGGIGQTQKQAARIQTLIEGKTVPALSVKDFGATGNGQVVFDAAITAGISTLKSNSATFTPADVSKLFDLNGAGTPSCGQQYWGITGLNMNCNLVGTITGYIDTHDVTLSVNAGTSVSGGQFKWGTDDTNALKAALTALTAPRGLGTLYFPSGNYCVSSKLQYAFVDKTLLGDGEWRSNLWQMNVVAYQSSGTYQMLTVDNGTKGLTINRLGFEGSNQNGLLTSSGVATDDGVLVCSGAPGGLGRLCNGDSGISNILVEDSRFDHFWGIGFHIPGTSTAAGQQVHNVTITDSLAEWNSADGFNPNVYDGLVMTGDIALNNGTGGVEATAVLNQKIANSRFAYNKVCGMAIGGFRDPTIGRSALIDGNTVYMNGNASASSTEGYGIIIGANQQNALVTRNTVKQNLLKGIGVVNARGATLTKNIQITRNYVSSNGLSPYTAGSATVGIYVAVSDVTVGQNTVIDEGLAGYRQAWGIQVVSNLSEIIIDPNYVSAPAQAYHIGSGLTNSSYRDPAMYPN